MNESKVLNLRVNKSLSVYKTQVKRRAQGMLKYDYLVPAGYYQEQWDWDGFFIGVALSSELPSEAIYLRNWALNYLDAADETGFTAGCVTPQGPETGHRLFLMKPFLAQGVFLASKFLNDYSWIKLYWPILKKIVLYRERHRWSKKYGLAVLKNSMETGADDNVAALSYPDNTVIAADINTYILREYKAMTLLARTLHKKSDEAAFRVRYENVKRNILLHLWHSEDKIFYNRSISTEAYIKRVSFSDFVPLWDGIAPRADGAASIRQYLLNPQHLWSTYGLRTLSKKDPEYNNVNRIKPYSNWQGPVWPIANYLYIHALLNYGFTKEASENAVKITRLILSDIEKSGGMHENYDAETGKPLAAPNFVSWNLLVNNLFDEVENNYNPFKLDNG